MKYPGMRKKHSNARGLSTVSVSYTNPKMPWTPQRCTGVCTTGRCSTEAFWILCLVYLLLFLVLAPESHVNNSSSSSSSNSDDVEAEDCRPLLQTFVRYTSTLCLCLFRL